MENTFNYFYNIGCMTGIRPLCPWEHRHGQRSQRRKLVRNLWLRRRRRRRRVGRRVLWRRRRRRLWIHGRLNVPQEEEEEPEEEEAAAANTGGVF